MAYHASLTDLYLHATFQSNWQNFLRTDGWMYIRTKQMDIETDFIRSTVYSYLISTKPTVDLKAHFSRE